MKKWLRYQFRDARSSFASVMAIAGCTGTLCNAAIIAIILMR